MRFGFQVKIDRGFKAALKYALELGCECIQTLIASPLSWKISAQPNEFKHYVEELRLNEIFPIAIHAPYLLNLSSPEDDIYNKSILLLCDHLLYAEEAGVDFVIVHAGSHKGAGAAFGMERLTSALRRICEWHKGKTMILVENTPGAGGNICSSIEDLELLLREVDKDKIGICLDTCHLFAYGYDLSSPEKVKALSEEVESKIGSSVKLLHLNDCRTPLGSKVDRHESLGKGMIGLRGIRAIISDPFFSRLPAIMETPYDPDEDKYNITLAKRLRMESNLNGGESV
ncbi:MAG: deoxyribonuclease IV [bacterium]